MRTGEKFIGQWVNNKFSEGILRHSNGDVYEGKFRDFKKNGEGTYTYSNGTIFKGIWKDDQKVEGT